jgi:hypothetical protein
VIIATVAHFLTITLKRFDDRTLLISVSAMDALYNLYPVGLSINTKTAVFADKR